MNSNPIITTIFFISVFLFGYLLSRAGKPYNGLLFNIHKLVGLALGIFLIATVYGVHKAGDISTAGILAVVLTVLVFLLLVAAGGLLSIDAEGGLRNASKSLLTAIALVHRIFPYLALLSTTGTLYLLLFSKT